MNLHGLYGSSFLVTFYHVRHLRSISVVCICVLVAKYLTTECAKFNHRGHKVYSHCSLNMIGAIYKITQL